MTDRTQCCMCDIWIDAPLGSVCADCAKPRQRPPATADLAAGGTAWTGHTWSTKASPVEDLVAAMEQFKRDHPPPEPFTMRQIRQAIQAAKALGIRPEDLLRALGQWPLPEMERLPVITEPTMPPNRMEWVTVSRLLPVVINLDADDVPPPSTECEDDLKARILKHAAQSYAKISIP